VPAALLALAELGGVPVPAAGTLRTGAAFATTAGAAPALAEPVLLLGALEEAEGAAEGTGAVPAVVAGVPKLLL